MLKKRWLLLLIFSIFTIGCAAPTFKQGTIALNQGDYKTALSAFKPLAEEEHAAAQYNLARMYSAGAGVQKDQTEAMKWLRKAAENGHPEAKSTLARLQQQERERNSTNGTNWGAWALGLGLGAILLNSITGGGNDNTKDECDDFYNRSSKCGFYNDNREWIRTPRLR